MAPAASGESPFVSPAYSSAAPRIAAAASTARMDNRRGTLAATAYPATPSTTLASGDAVPHAICAAAAAAARARKGSGHRLPNEAAGIHSKTIRSSAGPGACP